MKNAKIINPMLESTMRIVDNMEPEIDILIVAAFSMDKTVATNSMGQFVQLSDNVSPFDIARMLHSMLMQYIMANQDAIMSALEKYLDADTGSEADMAQQVKNFMDKMGVKPN